VTASLLIEWKLQHHLVQADNCAIHMQQAGSCQDWAAFSLLLACATIMQSAPCHQQQETLHTSSQRCCTSVVSSVGDRLDFIDQGLQGARLLLLLLLLQLSRPAQ